MRELEAAYQLTRTVHCIYIVLAVITLLRYTHQTGKMKKALGSLAHLSGATGGLTVTWISYLASVQTLTVLLAENRWPSCLKNNPCLSLGSTMERLTVNLGIFHLAVYYTFS